MNVRFTLVADGPFDAALIPILNQLLRSDSRVEEIESQFADPALLPKIRDGLRARVKRALALFPADIVFVHRDSEKEELQFRRQEVLQSVEELLGVGVFVPVVPVRMTEAWLLICEAAIRRAAGNPNGRIALNLPRLQDIELLPNPKQVLHSALTEASERRGRALAKFNISVAAARVVELIDDFEPLATLNAYKQLQTDIRPAIDEVERAMKNALDHPKH